jgi:hypothetical protein
VKCCKNNSGCLIPTKNERIGRRTRQKAERHLSRLLGQSLRFFILITVKKRTGRGISKATHKFRVGEKVQLLAGQGMRFATAEVFEIVQQLPERDGEYQYQYKIKSVDEPHLRVAKESQLRRV